MITMGTASRKSGGDDYFNRLLSYFNRQFKERIIKMVSIRESVFLVKTEKNIYVVKGYSTYNKLKLQETFTSTLRQEGFTKTYLYFDDIIKKPLFFEGEYFGCMEYLQPHPKAFSFHSHKNRLEGLELLEEYYSVTTNFEKRYKSLLSLSDIVEKWTDRYRTFFNNSSFLRYYMKEKYIHEMLMWAHWSLKGMKDNHEFFQKKPFVILHGDVAHHNFLRDASGTLNLIDFDLISIGPKCLDILQYANRILPFLDWSFDLLSKYPQINKYLKEKAFLYALAFPTDIFREWNRTLKHKSHTNSRNYKHVIDLTLGQYYLRKKLVFQLEKIVETSN